MNRSPTKKMFLLMVLALLMWIPLLLIENTVSERAGRRDSVQQEVAASLAGEQQILGPLLVIPYTYLERERVTVGTGGEVRKEERQVKRAGTLSIIPRTLKVSTRLTPVVLERGIFRAVTYQSETLMEGSFSLPKPLPVKAREAQWETARVSVGLGDVRGLSTTPQIEWNQMALPFEPGVATPVFSHGVMARVGELEPDTVYSFRITLSLRGTKRFFLAPIAQQFERNRVLPLPAPSPVSRAGAGTLPPRRGSSGADRAAGRFCCDGLAWLHPG